MRKHRPVTHFGKDRTTAGALGQFFFFVLVVLILYWIFGGFDSW